LSALIYGVPARASKAPKDINAALLLSPLAVKLAVLDIGFTADQSNAQTLKIFPPELLKWQLLKPGLDRRCDA